MSKFGSSYGSYSSSSSYGSSSSSGFGHGSYGGSGKSSLFKDGPDWSGNGWSGKDSASKSWAGKDWAGKDWNSKGWGSKDFGGKDWSGKSWGDKDWSGSKWIGKDAGDKGWGGKTWQDKNWESKDWGAKDWGDKDWGGKNWSGKDWSGKDWGDKSWGGDDWCGPWGGGGGPHGPAVCFTQDMLVETPLGTRRIADLEVGDRVLTHSHGYQTIRWIFRRHIGGDLLRKAPDLRPVTIEKDAFGPGRPARRCQVSPQHRVLIEGYEAEMYFAEDRVLVPAKGLIDDRRIWQDASCKDITYVHILFDQHEAVLADGIYSESFQPAQVAMDGLCGDARAEFETLFPHIAADPATYGPSCHLSVSVTEARVLLRHG